MSVFISFVKKKRRILKIENERRRRKKRKKQDFCSAPSSLHFAPGF